MSLASLLFIQLQESRATVDNKTCNKGSVHTKGKAAEHPCSCFFATCHLIKSSISSSTIYPKSNPQQMQQKDSRHPLLPREKGHPPTRRRRKTRDTTTTCCNHKKYPAPVQQINRLLSIVVGRAIPPGTLRHAMNEISTALCDNEKDSRGRLAADEQEG